MEIKNEKLFLVYTIALIAALVFVIVLFSQHPMGADFTNYNDISGQNLSNPETLAGQRVAVRGKCAVVDRKMLFTIQNQNNIIGWIRKRFDPTKGRAGQTTYEDFKTSDFTIETNGVKLSVKGQPQQIFDSAGRITSKSEPNLYWEVIKEGGEYSIFGTIEVQGPGQVILVPYRVTNLPISDIKTEAATENKKITFTQYIIIFAMVILYGLILWKTRIFGPPSDDEEDEDEDEDEEEEEDEEEKGIGDAETVGKDEDASETNESGETKPEP